MVTVPSHVWLMALFFSHVMLVHELPTSCQFSRLLVASCRPQPVFGSHQLSTGSREPSSSPPDMVGQQKCLLNGQPWIMNICGLHLECRNIQVNVLWKSLKPSVSHVNCRFQTSKIPPSGVSPLIYAEVALRINSTSGNVCQEENTLVQSPMEKNDWNSSISGYVGYNGIFTDMCVIVRGIMDIEKVFGPTLYLYDGKRQPSLTLTSFVGHIPIEAKSLFLLHCVLLHIILWMI